MTALAVTHRLGDQVSASDGDTELFRYVYSGQDPQAESPRPFFHPLRSRAGDTVSVYRPWDHAWHKGLALSLPHFGSDNFWGGGTYVHPDGYLGLENNGAQIVHGPTGVTADGRIAQDLVWFTQANAEVARERRTIRAALLGGDAWALSVTSELTNTSGETIQIGSPTTAGRPNAGYGGWFWRGPRSFTGGQIVTSSGTGGDEMMGATAPWAAFVGHHDETDRFSTVVMVDAASSLRHPTTWFARSSPFACLNPAPFFHEEYPFEPGVPLVLSAVLVVADGRSDSHRAGALATAGARLLE